MKTQSIREAFLDFFAGKGHKIIKSSPLLPKDDPTLLFTNAGMNQFKNIFLGIEKTSYKRAASVQKCMRVSGKHNDLEQVGRTTKHHTFFEMLGNFSFGDYFKEQAILYAWELIVDVYKMDKHRLYATVYKDDDEAFSIWHEKIGLPADRIFRFGKKDNYWAMGETGPCGPCSEIHYDLDPALEDGAPEKLIGSGSDRFFELWNLVFMQFHQDENGELHPLPSPSIDTGMGLERVATVLQGKTNNFETDLFSPLIEAIGESCQQAYGVDHNTDVALRIIADHIRALTFLIGDGITPANDGRGYVLRRLIRRAFRNGNKLGIEEPFLFKLVGLVCDSMKDAYPELLSSAHYIAKVCQSEEKRFSATLSSGLKTFQKVVDEARKSGKKTIPGTTLFRLYDTLGFPLDISKELAEEQGLRVDEKGFNRELENQRERARLSWKGGERQKELKVYERFKDLNMRFIGYENDSVADAEVIALLKKGGETKEIAEGESGEVFLDSTPFYAEAGGQVGDKGVLKNVHASAVVNTTYFPIPGVISHKVDVLAGKISLGDKLHGIIDGTTRKSISRNHTATHLLHASLRQIVGDHVKQAGSLVSPDRLRFDFTHFASLNGAEIEQLESLVNEKIRKSLPVETRIGSLEDGLKEGAIAIFEEKYGEEVRIVTINTFSKELCGGVHVKNTGEIGLFRIVSESSIASGMRRIEAVTGEEALRYTQENTMLLAEIQKILNVPKDDFITHIDKLKENLKEKEKEIRSLRQKIALTRYQKKEDHIRKINGISVNIQKVEGLNQTELRELADNLKQKIGSGVVILAAVAGKKVLLVSAVTQDLVNTVQAQEIIKKMAPLLGGGGGGRADFAQAGGTKTEGLDEILEKGFSIVDEITRKG